MKPEELKAIEERASTAMQEDCKCTYNETGCSGCKYTILLCDRNALLDEVKRLKVMPGCKCDACMEVKRLKVMPGCKCDACMEVKHMSSCAVHNEPAYANGECDCGAWLKVIQRDIENQSEEKWVIDYPYQNSTTFAQVLTTDGVKVTDPILSFRASFIAHSRQAVPDLLAEVKRLQKYDVGECPIMRDRHKMRDYCSEGERRDV